VTKIVYNDCFGGFSLSEQAAARYAEIKGLSAPPRYGEPEDRADPALVQVVEELGDAANGTCASLAIRELPAGTLYRIDEYDGNESVVTQDEYEWSVA